MKTENRTLLIVDDDPNIIKSLVRLLSKEGYEIHAYQRPVDALSKMQEVSAGVIISDHCMPHMEGAELLNLAKRYQPDAIRILLSGYYNAHSVAKIVDHCKAWRYVPKPWDDDGLRETVAAAFARFNHQTGE